MTVPVPVSDTVRGDPAALSEMVRAAVRVPLVEGLNVTLMAQLDIPATVVPQVLVSGNSELLEVMLPINSGSVAMLVRMTDCTELVVATA
jgi:hypothetical protein